MDAIDQIPAATLILIVVASLAGLNLVRALASYVRCDRRSANAECRAYAAQAEAAGALTQSDVAVVLAVIALVAVAQQEDATARNSEDILAIQRRECQQRQERHVALSQLKMTANAG